ncbi:MAG: hypothetical protein IIA99_06645, partial [Proteobacteria bacterium]|nr:hypothetical protein [Pseudomonadota bacterium]
MALVFEELDFQKTPLGEISLRRRSEPRLDGKILYEVKLGDDFLMSSLFTETEIQLSRLGFAALDGSELDIAVGGVGLGYTAVVTLEDPSVRTLMVIEVMKDWDPAPYTFLSLKYECYANVGAFNQDRGICDTIPSEYKSKAFCYAATGHNTNDCTALTTDNDRSKCLEYIAIAQKDPSICKLVAQNAREACDRDKNCSASPTAQVRE